MAWISLPANNLIIGENSLKLWCEDNYPGSILQVQVISSEEAGRLKEAFTFDGGLAGEAKTDSNNSSNIQASYATKAIITDMAEDSKLSPAEKATWRQSWSDITTNYTELEQYANSLSVSATALFSLYHDMEDLLEAAGVWDAPDSNFALLDTSLVDTSIAYFSAYETLVQACIDKASANAEAAANSYTSGWSDYGADVTGDNWALDVYSVNGESSTTVTANIAAAKTTIENMESDGQLSPPEKATWRLTWPTIVANYNALKAHAVTTGVSSAALDTTKDVLYTYLVSAGVWSAPDASYTIAGNALTTISAAYYGEFQKLDSLCTEEWSEQNADVTTVTTIAAAMVSTPLVVTSQIRNAASTLVIDFDDQSITVDKATDGLILNGGMSINGDMVVNSGGGISVNSGGGVAVNDGGELQINDGGEIILDSVASNTAHIIFTTSYENEIARMYGITPTSGARSGVRVFPSITDVQLSLGDNSNVWAYMHLRATDISISGTDSVELKCTDTGHSITLEDGIEIHKGLTAMSETAADSFGTSNLAIGEFFFYNNSSDFNIPNICYRSISNTVQSKRIPT